MRRQMHILTALIATALFVLGSGLPGPAMAAPTDFDVLSGGTLGVEVVPLGWATGMAASYDIPIEGGQATFDPETGALSSLSLDTAHRRFGLESLSQQGGSVTLPLGWAGGPIPNVALVAGSSLVLYDFDFQMEVAPASPVVVAFVVPEVVPEPTAALAFGVGVLAVGSAIRRRTIR